MTAVLGIIVIIASILLVLVVMVQNSKGGGLDTSNSMVNQIGNVAQSTETVEKVTWYLAAVIALVCLFSVFMGSPEQGNANVKATTTTSQGTPQ